MKQRRLRKKHPVTRDTVGGTVVLECGCGWKGWPPPGKPPYEVYAGPIPSERVQWDAYQKHLREQEQR